MAEDTIYKVRFTEDINGHKPGEETELFEAEMRLYVNSGQAICINEFSRPQTGMERKRGRLANVRT